MGDPTLVEYCFGMIGRANVAVNAWLPQASYPVVTFLAPLASNFEKRTRLQVHNLEQQYLGCSSWGEPGLILEPKRLVEGGIPNLAFPKPDNHAKLKCSCDNAEHVGLYLPESPAISSGSFIPNHGPSIIPAPRNQRAGGFYTQPVHSRGAIAFNRALALIEHQVQHEDNWDIVSCEAGSPLHIGLDTELNRKSSNEL
ncbi:hypothetical protein LTR70_003745 [Exophiala xenobiotica]|nr:hypothetical protein LTR70_003745 [Exophiala xenobiotica]